MKALFVIALIAVFAVLLEARSSRFYADDISDDEVEVLLNKLMRREPSMCPVCKLKKAGCDCKYRQTCVDRFCSTGSCTASNCSKG